MMIARPVRKWTLRSLAVVVLSSGGIAFGQAPGTSSSPDEAAKLAIAGALDESFPDRPEWVDMLADILQGSKLGPTDGWFRRATAQTRFDWEWAQGRFDGDGDGTITRAEFAGNDRDFARMDRDRDGAITEPDFDFSAHALTPSPGASVFYAADRDGNGKVTPEELEGFFKRADGGGLGFLSLSDLQSALQPPTRPAGAKAPAGPSKEVLVRGLFRQEIGSLQSGPGLGESAPDFTLTTNDGMEELTLSKVVGPKPVVLVFGNFTCGPFRSQAGNVEKLYRMYKDRAEFIMVYVREAHPTDGWRMESNDRVEVSLAQPQTYEERAEVARTCGSRLELGFPMLVDTIDDTVGARYSGMPSRLYLIDREGLVAYKSGRGPFGFKPAELEQALVSILQEGPAPQRTDAPGD